MDRGDDDRQTLQQEEKEHPTESGCAKKLMYRAFLEHDTKTL